MREQPWVYLINWNTSQTLLKLVSMASHCSIWAEKFLLCIEITLNLQSCDIKPCSLFLNVHYIPHNWISLSGVIQSFFVLKYKHISLTQSFQIYSGTHTTPVEKSALKSKDRQELKPALYVTMNYQLLLTEFKLLNTLYLIICLFLVKKKLQFQLTGPTAKSTIWIES